MSGGPGKLNPIYAALDAGQYNRAIKLATALPDTNVTGKALLAHAYTKSRQHFHALQTLNKVLGGQHFELQYEVDTCFESTIERENAAAAEATTSNATAASTTKSNSTSKKGKKGKKKPSEPPKQTTTGSTQQADSQPITSVPIGRDLVDQLIHSPTLPENFEALVPKELAITDETVLATLVASLQAQKLAFTTFQMYASAANAQPTKEKLRKTFTAGLVVLSTPSKWKPIDRLEAYVLSHMQAVALQWARMTASSNDGGSSQFAMMLATSWAARSSLWQLQWLPPDEKRSMILPRLAESMSQRLVKQEEEVFGQLSIRQNEPFRNSAEIQRLHLLTFEVQSQWDKMLESISVQESGSDDSDNHKIDQADNNAQSTSFMSKFGVSLSPRQILLEKSRILKHLCRWSEAREIFQQLLDESPDDWACWKGHLECSIMDERIEDTESLVESTLDKQKDAKFQLRGPHLMKVEIAHQRVKQNSSSQSFEELSSAIVNYAKIFARRANCAFSDVEFYLGRLAVADSDDTRNATVLLLEYVSSLLNESKNSTMDITSDDESTNRNKERRYRLRAYIFSLKVIHKLLAKFSDLIPKYMPEWKDVVLEWKAAKSLPISDQIQESQRDVMPNDDLMLLAVQQIIQLSSPSDKKVDLNDGTDNRVMTIAATLLEAAIDHSPDNAYLKFAAMEVYHYLNASTRIWELFHETGLKHVQLDSCSFVVLPYLLEGGLYNEAIELSNALLRFQKSSSKDSGDYAGRAMEHGTLSKADEFLMFQRKKLNPSLMFHFCKGLILDSAPLFATAVPSQNFDDRPLLKGGLGIEQGIVGGSDDMEHALQMIAENHNPYAALSVLSWACSGSIDDMDSMPDNRDLDILKCFKILIEPNVVGRKTMMCETLRRGHFHGLLVRATLCIDAMRGPKKGKLVKPTEQLIYRTEALLDAVLSASEMLSDAQYPNEIDSSLSDTLFSLCRFLGIINAGIPVGNDDDSLTSREERGSQMMTDHCLKHLSHAHSLLKDVNDPNIAYSFVPSFLVPIVALFRMSATVCEAYGWGKKKIKSKKCAAAMSSFATELNLLVQDLIKCLDVLPSSMSSDKSISIDLTDEELSFIDPSMLESTVALVHESRYRKRMRLEPVLQEIDEYLDEWIYVADK